MSYHHSSSPLLKLIPPSVQETPISSININNKENVTSSLTSEQLQQQLYESLKSNGTLTQLKTQLKSQLIHLLTSTSQQRKSNITREDTVSSKKLKSATFPTALLERATNSLLAEYLKIFSLNHTLSIFLTEIGETRIDQVLLPHSDILHILHINPQSHSHLYQVINQSTTPSLLFSILTSLTQPSPPTHPINSNSISTQTAESSPSEEYSIDFKLEKVEKEYEEKRKEVESLPYHTMEERMQKYQHDVNTRADKEIEKEIQRLKESELMHIRLEEREKFENQLIALRQEQDRLYQDKLSELKKKEDEIVDSYRSRTSALETEHYRTRQKLLDELDRLRIRELEVKRAESLHSHSVAIAEQQWREKNRLVEKQLNQVEEATRLMDQKLADTITETSSNYVNLLREKEEQIVILNAKLVQAQGEWERQSHFLMEERKHNQQLNESLLSLNEYKQMSSRRLELLEADNRAFQTERHEWEVKKEELLRRLNAAEMNDPELKYNSRLVEELRKELQSERENRDKEKKVLLEKHRIALDNEKRRGHTLISQLSHQWKKAYDTLLFEWEQLVLNEEQDRENLTSSSISRDIRKAASYSRSSPPSVRFQSSSLSSSQPSVLTSPQPAHKRSQSHSTSRTNQTSASSSTTSSVSAPLFSPFARMLPPSNDDVIEDSGGGSDSTPLNARVQHYTGTNSHYHHQTPTSSSARSVPFASPTLTDLSNASMVDFDRTRDEEEIKQMAIAAVAKERELARKKAEELKQNYIQQQRKRERESGNREFKNERKDDEDEETEEDDEEIEIAVEDEKAIKKAAQLAAEEKRRREVLDEKEKAREERRKKREAEENDEEEKEREELKRRLEVSQKEKERARAEEAIREVTAAVNQKAAADANRAANSAGDNTDSASPQLKENSAPAGSTVKESEDSLAEQSKRQEMAEYIERAKEKLAAATSSPATSTFGSFSASGLISRFLHSNDNSAASNENESDEEISENEMSVPVSEIEEDI